MKSPLSIRQAMWFSDAAALLAGGIAAIDGPLALRLVDAGICGVNLASVVWMAVLRRIQASQRQSADLLTAILELNGQLIAHEVQIVLQGAPPSDGPDAGKPSSLH